MQKDAVTPVDILIYLDTPVEGVDLGLGGGEGLLLLLQLKGDEGETLRGHVQLGLQLPGLVHQLQNLQTKGMACTGCGVFSSLSDLTFMTSGMVYENLEDTFVSKYNAPLFLHNCSKTLTQSSEYKSILNSQYTKCTFFFFLSIPLSM